MQAAPGSPAPRGGTGGGGAPSAPEGGGDGGDATEETQLHLKVMEQLRHHLRPPPLTSVSAL
eukprot:8762150-Pyramimonas_sp.AAC.1